jgi:DNA repair protein RecN (Recombination protein N)
MLTELRIENFAIIDHLDLEFSAGLIIFTGETGAGKSIIMDAIEMLLGGRAEATVIRADSERANVEAVFKLSGAAGQFVCEILQREELLDDANYVTIGREVRREGRSIARVNGRTVSVSLLREIGSFLLDIHGQTEHLSLLNPHSHLGLLDRYADVEPLFKAYRETYQKIQSVRRELNEIIEVQRDADRRREMLTFQMEEIESARVKPGEDDELRKERDRLANAESLATMAQEALTVIDEGTPDSPAVTDQLGQVVSALSSLARIDPSQNDLSDQAENMLETLSDMAHDLRAYLDNIEFNPKRLEQAEERLDLIQRLKRKYGGTIEAVIAHGAEARAKLETIANADDRITELRKQENDLLKKLSERALALSKKRKESAAKLAKGIERELDDLKMASAKFGADFQTRPDPNGIMLEAGARVGFDGSGIDRVEFLVAPNPGEGLKPLAKIASGGETSRLMLALKNVLASADQVPALIFDEIDQGIGGRVGAVVGEKLWRLGRNHQVFCITHLAPLASFGDQHFQVQKNIRAGRTTTEVKLLDGEERLLELALMNGEVTEGNLRAAHEMLQYARNTVVKR